jgi:HK97 family phage prohead protease
MSNKTIERRSVLGCELRASEVDEFSIIARALTYNALSLPGVPFAGARERIAPGAFQASLQRGDEVLACVNHDVNQLLGRTRNQTLTLSDDASCLRFTVRLNPAVQAHRDLHALVKDGTLSECSFAFFVEDEDWTEESGEDGKRYQLRTVMSSAVNADGDQIYPRKWNHDFIGLPIVQKEKQHRPTVTEAEVDEILAKAKNRYAVIFALLAGTGLRFGEALALKNTSLSPDRRVLFVRRSIWHGQEQEPKTPNAVREIDIPEPLAAMLREYAEGKSGYLFATASGRPLAPRNVLRALHATGKKVGFHAFRRFRTETLRRARVPEDLIGLWLGHSRRTITDLYATGLHQDQGWRREWCERVGLGFHLNGLHGLQNAIGTDSAEAA